jgi:hypothetical protein
MQANIKSKTGNAEVKKIGHTYSGQHGNSVSAQRRGYPKEPTTITFGKG